MTLSDDELRYIGDHLDILYEAASKLDGWHKDQARSFLDVGEYGLALEWIAYAYLNNGKLMAKDQFGIFDRLADMMNLQADPEYEGVARLRARS